MSSNERIEFPTEPVDQFALTEVSTASDEYLKNLIFLGKLAAAFGSWPHEIDEHVASKKIESCQDPQKGFEVAVSFLTLPHPIWRIQNHEYPYMGVNKRGNKYGITTGVGAYSFAPTDLVRITLRPDGLTSLRVANTPLTRQEYEEALRYKEPVELRRRVEGVTLRVQMKCISEFDVFICAYPAAIDPKAKRLLNRVTREAITEFSGIGLLSQSSAVEQKQLLWYTRFNPFRR